MKSVLLSVLLFIRDSLRTRAALQAEVLALRHQLLVLQRGQKQRLRLSAADRLLWVCLAHIWSQWREALRMVKPETVVAWHRKGFRFYWSWKSRTRQGRPSISTEVRELIRRMSAANPSWGAPRIHGELGKLGIVVSQTTVAKYMVRHQGPPSHTWRTFLNNHCKDLVSADFFVVPTATFRLLFVFVILAHDRRRPVHFAVTVIRLQSGQRNSSCRLFLGTPPRDFCCATATATTGTYSGKRLLDWGSRRYCALLAHRGRTRTLSG